MTTVENNFFLHLSHRDHWHLLPQMAPYVKLLTTADRNIHRPILSVASNKKCHSTACKVIFHDSQNFSNQNKVRWWANLQENVANMPRKYNFYIGKDQSRGSRIGQHSAMLK